MQELLGRVRLITKTTFGLVVFALFALLFGIMFLGGPIAILAESYDLFRFDGRANGQLTHLDIVQGSKGTSGIRVTYTFFANADRIESKQLYPGFAANYGTYSGGSSLAQKYTVGAQVPVFYDSTSPTHSCLEYGWHQWSIGWTAGIWGMVAYVACRVRKSQLWIGSMASMLYGFSLIAIGPHTVYVNELHWHILSIMLLTALVTIYSLFRQSDGEQRDPHESPAGPEFET